MAAKKTTKSAPKSKTAAKPKAKPKAIKAKAAPKPVSNTSTCSGSAALTTKSLGYVGIQMKRNGTYKVGRKLYISENACREGVGRWIENHSELGRKLVGVSKIEIAA
jgi:hypothetical protein